MIYLLWEIQANPSLQPKELDLIKTNGINSMSYCSVYSWLYLQRKCRVITTCSATKVKKRIDYCVMYEAEIRLYKYGLMQKLIMSPPGCFNTTS